MARRLPDIGRTDVVIAFSVPQNLTAEFFAIAYPV
jgi:hypothetical protein